MYKYDGLVIYQNHDEEGVLEVVERNGVRSLHFGSTSRQSSIDLNDPETLQLPYARAMASWLLFKTEPQNVIIVGLGGGSIAKHLLHYFPDCRIKAVEYRANVVKIARSHFRLPLDTRLKVIVEDGGHYVREQAKTHQHEYDLMIIDAFDVDGLAPSIAGRDFFEACKLLLKPEGILAINLWATEKKSFNACTAWLSNIFADKVLLLPVRNRGNLIGLAFNDGFQRIGMKELKHRAEQLEQTYRIEFPNFVKDLKKYNPYHIHAVVNL